MSKKLFTLICLLAMISAGAGLRAQEVTIVIEPGWNWISYPNAEAMPLAEALSGFVPSQGDQVKSKYTTSTYTGGRWRGGVSYFEPGKGYHYYSTRTEDVELVFAHASSNAVATATPTDITATSAMAGGMVMLPEGTQVFLRGVCWGTAPSPDIDGDHTTEETGIGIFSSTLEGLTPNTTYYLRSYVVYDHGLAYGNELSFTTEVGGGSGGDAPTGAIDGKFTINSDGDQVYFSQGNLQYIGSAATPYWKFADNQWDVLGTTTGQNSSDQNVDRDLFGWGTSGWNNGNMYYQPYDTESFWDSETGYGYGPTDGTNYNYDLTGDYANADWGVYNAISNGGNTPNQWRTLTYSEWSYVINDRSTPSGIRYAKGIVNGVQGFLLLPDDWSASVYALNYTNRDDAPYTTNEITAEGWATMESAGAVFLPAAGYRPGTSVYNVGLYGNYWSSSLYPYTPDHARYFNFNAGNAGMDGYNRYNGYSVRLVRDVN